MRGILWGRVGRTDLRVLRSASVLHVKITLCHYALNRPRGDQHLMKSVGGQCFGGEGICLPTDCHKGNDGEGATKTLQLWGGQGQKEAASCPRNKEGDPADPENGSNHQETVQTWNKNGVTEILIRIDTSLTSDKRIGRMSKVTDGKDSGEAVPNPGVKCGQRQSEKEESQRRCVGLESMPEAEDGGGGVGGVNDLCQSHCHCMSLISPFDSFPQLISSSLSPPSSPRHQGLGGGGLPERAPTGATHSSDGEGRVYR